jgi:hypothetical protein
VSTEDAPQEIGDVRVDTANLYREEVYTDLRVATSGQTNLMSQAGPLPVECPIEAASLDEAALKFPEAMKAAVERLMEEAKEIRRREASRIVVPGGPLPGGGVPGGGGGIIGGGR